MAACRFVRWTRAICRSLSRYGRAGVDAAFINIGYGEHSIELHLRMIAQFRRWLSLRPDEYIIIRAVGDIERARREGKLAVGFDIEGARAIGDQLSLVQLYYDLGVRWMLIAYNRGNLVGGGCHDRGRYGPDCLWPRRCWTRWPASAWSPAAPIPARARRWR